MVVMIWLIWFFFFFQKSSYDWAFPSHNPLMIGMPPSGFHNMLRFLPPTSHDRVSPSAEFTHFIVRMLAYSKHYICMFGNTPSKYWFLLWSTMGSNSRLITKPEVETSWVRHWCLLIWGHGFSFWYLDFAFHVHYCRHQMITKETLRINQFDGMLSLRAGRSHWKSYLCKLILHWPWV